MSWIKENPFVAGLAGVTAVVAGGLIYAGINASGQYDEHKAAYDADVAQVATFQKAEPYPDAGNRQAKKKSVDEYRGEIVKLQEAFNAYRSPALEKVTPQKFTDDLKESDRKIRAAFAANNANGGGKGTIVPDAFFVGFPTYKAQLAPDAATGILGYELGALTEIFLDLAKAAPKELKNVYRQALEEESGKTFEDKDAVYRAMPMEITFRGSEKSVRDFTTALAASTNHFFVIRSLRIENEKKTGPTPADAKFTTTKAGGAGSATAGGASADPFAAFSLPSDGAAAGGTKPAAASDTSRNLQKIAGGEDLTVFLRIDILQFLAAKELK